MLTECVAERFESILLDVLSFNCIFPLKFDFDSYLTVTGKDNSNAFVKYKKPSEVSLYTLVVFTLGC